MGLLVLQARCETALDVWFTSSENALAGSLGSLLLVRAGGLPTRLVTQVGQYKVFAIS